MAIFLLRKIRK